MSSREMKNIRHNEQPLKKKSGGELWVKDAFSHNKGKLHSELGVPKDKKIPLSKLHKAEHSKNPTLRKRATLAETARNFNHRKM